MTNTDISSKSHEKKSSTTEPFLVRNLGLLILLIAIIALVATSFVSLAILQLKPNDVEFINLFTTRFSSAKLGTIGDFFGGLLNPVFGFLALLALLANLYVQRHELSTIQKATLKSNEIQSAATELSALVSLMEYKREHEQRVLDGKPLHPPMFFRIYNFKEREAEFDRKDIDLCAQRIEEILNKMGGLEIDNRVQRMQKHKELKDYFDMQTAKNKQTTEE
jgi:uncharacterized membrane protein